MWRLKFFVCIVLLCLFTKIQGQNILLDSISIKEQISISDTLWFFNHNYDMNEPNDQVNLYLVFKDFSDINGKSISQIQINYIKINSVNGSKVGVLQDKVFNLADDTLKFETLNSGIYQISLKFIDRDGYPTGNLKTCFLFNKKLEADIVEAKENKDGNCLKGEPDTCVFALNNHLFNPKGTKYEMSFVGDEDKDFVIENYHNTKDTFSVIFNGPVGDRELFVKVVASYEYINNGVKKVKREPYIRPAQIRKYDRPNLNEIFSFKDTIVDNIIGCTGSLLSDLRFDESINKKYMDGNQDPEFASKSKYTIRYFRKDSVKQRDWVTISESERDKYIEDVENFIFQKSGIYRLYIEAENKCGKDTLDTEIVRNAINNEIEEGISRVIKIYNNDVKSLNIDKTLLCLNNIYNADTLIFRDSTERLNWEESPVYDLIIKRILKDVSGKDSLVDINNKVCGTLIIKEFPNINGGNDSTILYCPFYEAGHYEVTLKKTSSICAESSIVTAIIVGREPELPKDEWWKDKKGFPNKNGTLCGIFKYGLPQEISIDTNYVSVDKENGYEWKFGKGKHVEQFIGKLPVDSVMFDSTDITSYITLRVRNKCGWSTLDSIPFTVYTLPQVSVWRDSLQDCDTLCVNTDYDYFFKGMFPENYLIICPEKGLTLNDSVARKVNSGSFIGKTYEHYSILNMTSGGECIQTIEDSVWIVNRPVFSVVDTVHFCSSINVIKTWALLTSDLSDLDYNLLKWSSKKGSFIAGTDIPEDIASEKRKDFLNLQITADTTHLHYDVINGGRCSFNGEIVLLRHKDPQLDLAVKKKEVCEGEMLDLVGADFMTSTVKAAQNLTIKIGQDIYYPFISENKLYQCPSDIDSITVTYYAKQQHTYLGEKGCNISDSIKLYISHPRLKILKRDTVSQPTRIYDFANTEVLIDTNDVFDLGWKVVQYGDASKLHVGSDIFNYTYDFKGASPQADSAYFELIGKDICGHDYKDTLKVWNPIEQLIVPKDLNICNSEKEYTLWSSIPDPNKVYGYFIKTTTDEDLKWRILSGGDKGQIVGKGSHAKFVLANESVGGEVEIEVTAKSEISGLTLPAISFKLNISKAPVFVLNSGITMPCILVEQDSLDISKVGNFQYAQNIQWHTLRGGKFLDKNYIPAYTGYELYRDSIYYESKALDSEQKGCPGVFRDTLTMLVYPQPFVSLDKDSLKMCAGDHLVIGEYGKGTVTIKGINKKPIWICSSGCLDCLKNQDNINNTIEFIPTGSGFEKIYISVQENLTNYKGDKRLRLGQDSIVIKIYHKPQFSVKDGRDTICAGVNTVNLGHFTVVNPNTYPLMYIPTKNLSGVYPDYNWGSGSEDSAKVYIQANLDGCSKWDDYRDSIVIVRLPDISVSLKSRDSVCSNGTLVLAADTKMVRYSWNTLHGGTLTNTNTLRPVYTPPITDITFDTVCLTVKPLLERCPGEFVWKESIKIIPMPDFILEKDSVCTNELTYTLNYKDADKVKSVTWSSDGDGSFENVNAIIPVYRLGENDKNRGRVSLSANIIPNLPCDGAVVTRQMELEILKAPEITIKPDANLSVCQGDSLDIDFINADSGVETYLWETDHGIINNKTLKIPRFYPGEYSGQVKITVKLTGNKECVSAPQEFNILVKPSMIPEILSDKGICQSEEFALKTNVVAQSYEWLFNNKDLQNGNNVSYIFNDPGKKGVNLTVTYSNGCKRSVSDSIEVYSKPQPQFKADSTIVGINKEIHFVNNTKGNIAKQWWYIDGVNFGEDKDFIYRFEQSDVYEITLEVENDNGCRNKGTESIVAILKPKAIFTVKLKDESKPCDNSEAIFTNNSSGDEAYLTYEWILNTNNRENVDTTTRLPRGVIRYNASLKQDTVYDVTLIVKNAAGNDTLTQQIKIVPDVKPKLEVITHDSGCTPILREIANQTIGSADWYRINWGDGSSDTTFIKNTGRNLIHRYDNNTDKIIIDTIRLYAGNVCKTDSAKVPIKLYPNTAIAKIKVDDKTGIEGCYMFEAKFQNVSTGFGGINKALWNFGEEEPMVESNSESITNLYEKPGEYKVTLTVFDECNSDTDSLRIKVKGNDKLNFIEPDIICSNDLVKFKVDPEIKDLFYNYYWCLDYKTNPVWIKHNELEIENNWNPGEYTVALKATSLDGCEVYQPAFKTVKVYKKPVADFNLKADGNGDYQNCQQVLTGCQPLKVDFQRIGNSGGDITYWDFGGDGASSELSPIHTFGDTGPFTVKMKVTTSDGCVDSTQGVVSVLKSPEPSFDILSDKLLCTPDGNFNIRLHNTTDPIQENTYQWFYNLNQFSDSQEPSEYPLRAQFGKIGIMLRATNILSACSKEYSDTIVSSPVVVADFTIEPQKVCEGETVKLNSHSLPGDQVEWDLGDRSGLYTDTVIDYLYEKPGEYTVKIKLQNEYGCEAPAEKSVWVYPMPTADFTYEFDNRVIDEELSNIDFENPGNIPTGGVIFTNHSTVQAYDFVGENPLTYKWLVNDAEIVGKDLRYQFDNNGSYVVKLVAVGANQCRDTFADVVNIGAVKGLFIPNAFAPATGIDENPGTALFLPKGVGLYSYKIQIFDQWGRCVWSSEKLEDGKPAEAWDGTVEGEPLPKDVYLWKVNAVFIDGSVWTGEGGNTQGYVTLIR